MKLKSLEISLQPNWASAFPNEYVGTLHVENPNGAVSIRLNPTQCGKILDLVFDAAITTVTEAAESLRSSMLRKTLTLENVAPEIGLD